MKGPFTGGGFGGHGELILSIVLIAASAVGGYLLWNARYEACVAEGFSPRFCYWR